jgi:hypothetical protein
MLYKNSYLYKEIRQSNIENRISIRNGVFFGVFTALIAYFFHMCIMHLTDTVFADSFPYLLKEDFFSPVYTYMRTSVVFCVLYFVVLYDNISLSEIRSNRWYLLAKMGYNTKMMVTVKTLAQFFALLFTYFIGFAVSLGIAYLSNYAFSIEYLPALFLCGVVEIAFLCFLTTALSLLYRFRTVFYSRCSIILSEALLITLSELTGFRQALSSQSFISEHGMLSPFSPTVSVYFISVLVFIAVLTTVSLHNAKVIAKYYDEPLENTDFTLPAGRVLARLDHRTGKFYVFRKNTIKIHSVVFGTVFIAFLSTVVIASLVLNLFYFYNKKRNIIQINEQIYFMSDSEVKTEFSEKPLAYTNDLLIFKAVDSKDSIINGIPVLIKTDVTLEVQPYSDRLQDADIRGELYAVSRWIGALVLLANNTEGRIIFLVLPLLMLFLYKKIRKLLMRKIVFIE